MDEISNRIKEYLAFKDISVEEFRKKTGVVLGETSFTLSRINALITTYPDINREWLVLGQGAMLNANNTQFQDRQNRFKNLIGELNRRGIVKNQKELGERLGFQNESYFSRLLYRDNISADFLKQIKELLPDINTEYLTTGVGSLLIDKPNEAAEPIIDFGHPAILSETHKPFGIKKAYLVPDDAYHSEAKDIMTYVENNKDVIMYAEPSQYIKPYDLMYRVNNSSMKPSIEKGDIIFLKQISADSKTITNGNVYFIDSKNNGILLRIVKHDGDKLACFSSSDFMEPVRLDISEIKMIFEIVAILKFDVPLMHNCQAALRMELEEKNKQIGFLSAQIEKQGNRIDSLLELLNYKK